MNDITIDHVGIATSSLSKASGFWEMLGFIRSGDQLNENQGVRIRMFDSPRIDANNTSIELLEPIGPDSPIGRFIAKRGDGIQQLAVRVPDIRAMISKLSDSGVRMINEEPVQGASGSIIAFVHPSSTGGVLVELVERPD